MKKEPQVGIFWRPEYEETLMYPHPQLKPPMFTLAVCACLPPKLHGGTRTPRRPCDLSKQLVRVNGEGHLNARIVVEGFTAFSSFRFFELSQPSEVFVLSFPQKNYSAVSGGFDGVEERIIIGATFITV